MSENEDRATGFPEPPGKDPGDHSKDDSPHHALNTPVGESQTGSTSTSEPHPSDDPEADPWEGPKRDKVDQ